MFLVILNLALTAWRKRLRDISRSGAHLSFAMFMQHVFSCGNGEAFDLNMFKQIEAYIKDCQVAKTDQRTRQKML